MKNFALIGAAGYIAPRHLRAIGDTKNRLVAAVDPNTSVGILDSFFPNTQFFTEIEQFFDYIDKSNLGPEDNRIHYISICSPSHLHHTHIQMTLKAGSNAICEKPMSINPADLDRLRDVQEATGKKVNCVVQLRLHPSALALKELLEKQRSREPVDVCVTYVTHRGPWHQHSWKSQKPKSGGLAIDKGIHLFDLLIWLFGRVESSRVHLVGDKRMAGVIDLEWAHIRWFLSLDITDLPKNLQKDGRLAFRSVRMNGEEFDLTSGFTDLHTDVYKYILSGQNFGTIDDVQPAIELAYSIMNSEIVSPSGDSHPFLI